MWIPLVALVDLLSTPPPPSPPFDPETSELKLGTSGGPKSVVGAKVGLGGVCIGLKNVLSDLGGGVTITSETFLSGLGVEEAITCLGGGAGRR